ncbi:MAG: DEAD/DEAH box helicase family protein [Candidatus Firestonebacteria bacterium]
MPKKVRSQKPIIELEQKLPEISDRNAYAPPKKHLVKDGKGGYKVENYRRPSRTLLPNQIRQEVDKWRDSGYKNPVGISDTSLKLLEWWFDEIHQFESGEEFQYYFTQREAIETIIYLYEVLSLRDVAELVFKYMDPKLYSDDLFAERKKVQEDIREKRILSRVVPETNQVAQQEIPQPDHCRYAIKMATGSGKTLVMAMAIVWSYYHKKYERDSSLSKTILIMAPNIIVFERLREDFENCEVFRKWDLIPNEFEHEWQMTAIMRGESRKTSTDGTIYLTNIQQLYESRTSEDEIENPVEKLMGRKPSDSIDTLEQDILSRIKNHKDLLIINDEAHHVHDTDLEWYKVILNLHKNLKKKHNSKLSLHLDFSATPKDQNGTFFSWIICDYPLAQAIEDRIVKSPLIVHQTDKSDPEKYSRASVAYAEWINVAIDRWTEHYREYKKVGSKPVLFIMAENTKDADDIYESLKKKDEFRGKDDVLLIHTDKRGDIKKDDLEKAREAARSIDLPNNKIKVIVSVMMLREGWDVKSVSVILGLRPFTSKAKILPEQAIGRGLRLMKNIGPDYVQIVEIIGTNGFESFVKELEVEGVGVGITRTPPPLGIHIYPAKLKSKYDIEIPILNPKYGRDYKGLDNSVLEGLPKNPRNINFDEKERNSIRLVETVTQVVLGQRNIQISTGLPEANEIISHLTNRISKEVRIDSMFSLFYPIVKKYVQSIFFGFDVDINNEKIRRQLTKSENTTEIITTLSKAIGKKSILKLVAKKSQDPLHLIEIEGFYWRRDWVELEKTIFNVTPCFNNLERHFATFLDNAKDINKFAKLAESYTKFSLPYTNKKGAIALYYPDFVAEQEVRSKETKMWLIETKGKEDEDVKNKDDASMEWCKDVTEITGVKWEFLKVKYDDYIKLSASYSRMPAKTLSEFLIMLNEIRQKSQMNI